MTERFFMGRAESQRVSGAVAKQFPLFGDGAPVYFWADKGLVRFRDERPGLPEGKKYGAMLWRDAARRVLELSALIIRSSESQGRQWGHERERLQKFICEMEEVIRQAKEQGGPTDGSAVARAHLRARRTTIIPHGAPSVATGGGEPSSDRPDLQENTGRQAPRLTRAATPPPGKSSKT